MGWGSSTVILWVQITISGPIWISDLIQSQCGFRILFSFRYGKSISSRPDIKTSFRADKRSESVTYSVWFRNLFQDWNGLRIISRVGEVSRPVPVSLWFQEQLQIWNLCLGSDTLPVMVKNQSSFPFICPGVLPFSTPWGTSTILLSSLTYYHEWRP